MSGKKRKHKWMSVVIVRKGPKIEYSALPMKRMVQPDVFVQRAWVIEDGVRTWLQKERHTVN